MCESQFVLLSIEITPYSRCILRPNRKQHGASPMTSWAQTIFRPRCLIHVTCRVVTAHVNDDVRLSLFRQIVYLCVLIIHFLFTKLVMLSPYRIQLYAFCTLCTVFLNFSLMFSSDCSIRYFPSFHLLPGVVVVKVYHTLDCIRHPFNKCLPFFMKTLGFVRRTLGLWSPCRSFFSRCSHTSSRCRYKRSNKVLVFLMLYMV